MNDLPRTFPERGAAIARRAGLTFFGVPPEVIGRDPVMRFPRPLGEASAIAIGLCGDAAAEVWRRRTGITQVPRVEVRRAAAVLAGYAFQVLSPGSAAIRTADWEMASDGLRAWGARSMLRGENASNPAVGIYQTRDGRWFHVHGGLPHLAAKIMSVLGTDAQGIEAAVANWNADDLEEALAAAGTCGVAVREAAEWASHPQGRALAGRPAVEILRVGDGPPRPLPVGDRPLGGLRVLDLSTALAGPTCARTLAEHGADVLRIAAPERADRQPFEIDTGHGKRASWLDLDDSTACALLYELAGQADVFAQSYRTGALARRGFGVTDIASLAPGAIYVSINCYGHDGPWCSRRGWEGLAQATTGLTVPRSNDESPRLAPGSVCDYLTGYLAARGVMEAVLRRADEGGTWHVRASLCQTGTWLVGLGSIDENAAPDQPDLFQDFLVDSETPYGHLRHLPPALGLPATPPHWDRPPPLPGSHAPQW